MGIRRALNSNALSGKRWNPFRNGSPISIENVVIAVEDEPTAADLGSIEGDTDADSEILGIYRGVALTERTHDMPLLPDEIAVFRGPIGRIARTRREAVQEVRGTVIHELGHYFGLNDDEMPH